MSLHGLFPLVTSNEQLATKKARVAGSVFPCPIVLLEVSITTCKIISSPKYFEVHFLYFLKISWLYVSNNLKHFSQKYLLTLAAWFAPPCHIMPEQAMNSSI